MHELAICQSILGQAAAIAKTHGAATVTKVSLRIGPLAGVEPALLRAAFPLAAAGTCCAAALLWIETAGVTVQCQLCGATSGALPNRLLCASCGTWRVTLRGGDEMRIEALELAGEEMADV
jgi:hydrogenase nickel incorporation protein HypA/HybF